MTSAISLISVDLCYRSLFKYCGILSQQDIVKNRFFLGTLLCVGLFLVGISFIPQSYAHLEHFSHYNGGGDEAGKYYVYQALDPEYTRPGEPTSIIFSVQDSDGNDVYNIETMVEIYEAVTEKRLYVFPWTQQEVGDFLLPYTFENPGNYHIVLSISDKKAIHDNDDSTRSIISNTLDCNCERVVFNVSITEHFGTIYNSVMTIVIIGPITVLGVVLWSNYREKKKKGIYKSLAKPEFIKYAMMLLGLAGGIIHLAVYSEHASLRIEYSVFLLVAGCSQVVYGVLYVLITLFESSEIQSRESVKSQYRKVVVVNLFGLFGTAVLLGLYIYVVIFPPPLSPTNQPEELEFAGILSKSVEALLVIGIVYLMRYEKTKLQSQLYSIK